MCILKDTLLDNLAEYANFNQFVSYSPAQPFKQRYSRIYKYPKNYVFLSPKEAIRTLIESSTEKSVNIRSFDPARPNTGEFIYRIANVDDVITKLHLLADAGFYTIVNETIDFNDGGVSGVTYGGIIEFAPNDTPRCVEKPGVASFPVDIGIRLLEKVYGFLPSLNYTNNLRVEFSIHPIRRGYCHDHTIIWEREEFIPIKLSSTIAWPNKFSRWLGDKAFGLLLADTIGLPVPNTLVIPRNLPPFRFGENTGTCEVWIRTCPREQVPGLFTTQRGWCDPFILLNNEDPQGNRISSILSQEGVEPQYSGAAATDRHGKLIVEGVKGPGDSFMNGQAPPESLPDKVIRAVKNIFAHTGHILGDVRTEWVYDGKKAWVVQLHRGATTILGNIIYPGEVSHYDEFNVDNGIEELRSFIKIIAGTGRGIVLVGNVGMTSHFGDLLRRAHIPSKLKSKN